MKTEVLPNLKFDSCVCTYIVEENRTEVAMKERHKATVFGVVFVVYTLLVAGMFYAMGAADGSQTSAVEGK